MNTIETVSERAVDVAAVGAITFVAVNGDPTVEVVAALTTIALGKAYMARS